jgi:Tol biopolymer transport system component
MAPDGGQARQLTHGETESYYPAWSPDGTEIVKEADGLSVISAQGTAGRRLTSERRDLHPDWSPDGRWVVFDSGRDGIQHLWRIPASGGPAEPLSRGSGVHPRWSVDGKHVYFLGIGERLNAIWSLSLESREERPVTALIGRRGALGPMGLALNDRFIYFTWEEARGDISVADLVSSPIK